MNGRPLATQVGELTGETAGSEIMDTAPEAGINFYDTADFHGGPQSPDMEKGFGISGEISVGDWPRVTRP